jgi:hypothetical protein
MHVRTVAKARELLAAAFEALMILDPDGAVIVRTGNREIHTVAEILPSPELADPWMPEDPPKPAPELVIPPAAQPHLPDGSPNQINAKKRALRAVRKSAR